jgi:hypothetical protein
MMSKKKSVTQANNASWQLEEENAEDKSAVDMVDGNTARLNESDAHQQTIKRPIPSSVMDASLSNLIEHSYLSQTIEVDPSQPLSIEINTSSGKLTIYLDDDENISIYRYPDVLAIHRRSLGDGERNLKEDFDLLRKATNSALQELITKPNSDK